MSFFGKWSYLPHISPISRHHLVREDGVRLDELLREVVVESLEEEGAYAVETISPYLVVSRRISPYLPVSRRAYAVETISPYLPASPRISSYLEAKRRLPAG